MLIEKLPEYEEFSSFLQCLISEDIALPAQDMLHTEIFVCDGGAIIFLKLHCHRQLKNCTCSRSLKVWVDQNQWHYCYTEGSDSLALLRFSKFYRLTLDAIKI